MTFFGLLRISKVNYRELPLSTLDRNSNHSDGGFGGLGVGAFLKVVVFYPKRVKTSSKHEVLIEKLKTVLPAVILKKNPNL